MTTRRETIESTLDGIVKTYRSFDGYIREGLKMSDSELDMLRRLLLEL